MAKSKQATQTYSELSHQLATQLELLESSDIEVDQAVEAYKQGLEIIAKLEARILAAENRVSVLRASSTIDGEV